MIENNDLVEAKEKLETERRLRSDQCRREIDVVLLKYRCRLEPQLFMSRSGYSLVVQVVAED